MKVRCTLDVELVVDVDDPGDEDKVRQACQDELGHTGAIVDDLVFWSAEA